MTFDRPTSKPNTPPRDTDALWEYAFTVFTPTWNRKPTMRRLYESLCRQSFQDFEWVIVDDGSWDGTEAMVAAWQSEGLIPIRYFSQLHRGKPTAFNLGVREARGELFLPVDSDDECVPNALERLRYHWDSIPKEERSEFVGVTALAVDRRGRLLGTPFPFEVLDSDSRAVRYRWHVEGDKAGFQRTEVLRAFPFPEVTGATFVPEGIIWGAIARKYRTRFVNESLRVVGGRDQPTGDTLTGSPAANHAAGLALWHRTVLNDDMREWFGESPLAFVRSAVHYARFSAHQDTGLREQAASLEHGLARTLWLLALPVGRLLYALDKGRAYRVILSNQSRPFRFLLSRLLMRSGVSRRLRIRRNGYVLRFHDAALSATLWIDSAAGRPDEAFLRSYLRPGDVVVDVGANIGHLTLTAASSVGPAGRVLGVEPHPGTFRHLADNVRLNGARNVTLHNVALGSKSGTSTLTDESSDDLNRIRRDGIGIPVPLLRLDDLPLPSEHIALVKVDVEGYELSVFRGGSDTLRRTKCVLFESWDRHFAEYGHTSAEVFESLKALGFQVYRRSGQRIALLPSDYLSVSCENLLALRDLDDFVARTNFVLDDAPPIDSGGGDGGASPALE